MKTATLITELGTSETLVPKQAEGLESLNVIVKLPKDDFKQIISQHSIFVPTFSTARYSVERFNNITSDGFPILEKADWILREDFFTKQIESAEPCIITRELVDNSVGKNILKCQFLNIEHIQKNLPLKQFSENFGHKLIQARTELMDFEKKLTEKINSEDPKAVDMLCGLQVFKLTNPSLPLLLQFIAKMEHQTGKRLLNSSAAFTSSIGLGNSAIIHIGNFSFEGAEIMGLLLKGKLPNTGSVVRLRLKDLFA